MEYGYSTIQKFVLFNLLSVLTFQGLVFSQHTVAVYSEKVVHRLQQRNKALGHIKFNTPKYKNHNARKSGNSSILVKQQLLDLNWFENNDQSNAYGWTTDAYQIQQNRPSTNNQSPWNTFTTQNINWVQILYYVGPSTGNKRAYTMRTRHRTVAKQTMLHRFTLNCIKWDAH